jgi:membrane-bound metal-dependent hydrolase YbcI (DUF457 family)
MFILGHIGFGRTLARPWLRRLPTWPLVIGTLLPDLIDKPLYYAHVWTFISCTRTFGHTGLLMLAVATVAYLRHSRVLAALALGMATHVVLDCALDWMTSNGPSTAFVALTWPILSRTFAVYDFASMRAHLQALISPAILATEVIGLVLIVGDYVRRKRVI